MDNSANNRRIAKNSVLLSIRMFIVLGLSLYISRVTLQNLGVEDYGIYNVVCGFVTMFTFLSAAMVSAIQRFYNYEYGKNGVEGANRVFMTALVSQALLAAVIVIFLEGIGLWYIHHKMVIPESRFFAAQWIFQISVISMVVSMFQAPFDAAIMAHEKMGFYAFLSLMNQVLKLAIVLLLPCLPGDKLITYGLLFFLVILLDVAVSALYSRWKFEEVRFRKTSWQGTLFKDMFSFSGWSILGSFALTMKEEGLNLILNLFFGPVVNAARGLAFQVTSALNGFSGNVYMAVKPQLTQSYAKGDISRTFKLMFANAKIGYMVLYLLALPVCLNVDFVLRLWLGANVPDYTNSFIMVVFLITLISGLQGSLSFVVHASGNLKLFSIVTSLITLMVLPCAYLILGLGYGPVSVFWVSLVLSFINYLASIYLLWRIVPFSLKQYAREVVFPLLLMSVLALPVPALICFCMTEGWSRLLVSGAVSVLCTAIAAYWGAFNKEERAFVSNAVKARFNQAC